MGEGAGLEAGQLPLLHAVEERAGERRQVNGHGGKPLSPALSPLVPRGERENGTCWPREGHPNCRPKGCAALSRSTSFKPPALPEVWSLAPIVSFDTQEQGGFQGMFAFNAVLVVVRFLGEAGKMGFE